jgi:hypothetical protein
LTGKQRDELDRNYLSPRWLGGEVGKPRLGRRRLTDQVVGKFLVKIGAHKFLIFIFERGEALRATILEAWNRYQAKRVGPRGTEDRSGNDFA